MTIELASHFLQHFSGRVGEPEFECEYSDVAPTENLTEDMVSDICSSIIELIRPNVYLNGHQQHVVGSAVLHLAAQLLDKRNVIEHLQVATYINSLGFK
jgi:hypothetical protein